MSSDLDGDRLGRMSHLAEISQRFSNTWMKLHFFLNFSLNIGSCLGEAISLTCTLKLSLQLIHKIYLLPSNLLPNRTTVNCVKWSLSMIILFGFFRCIGVLLDVEFADGRPICWNIHQIFLGEKAFLLWFWLK